MCKWLHGKCITRARGSKKDFGGKQNKGKEQQAEEREAVAAWKRE
jgi:hypothetical protein